MIYGDDQLSLPEHFECAPRELPHIVAVVQSGIDAQRAEGSKAPPDFLDRLEAWASELEAEIDFMIQLAEAPDPPGYTEVQVWLEPNDDQPMEEKADEKHPR